MNAIPPARPAAPEWCVADAPVPYEEALAAMEAHVGRMAAGEAAERIWLLQHPSVVTAGTSAAPGELIDHRRFPVVQTGRGGRFTYHGPGQRVVYPMLDLAVRGRDVRSYVNALEAWVIAALSDFGIRAFTSSAGTGIWVSKGDGIAKIGAIGVRVRRWISFHGVAINVSTDLSHYGAIIPCGIADQGVTRLVDHVPGASMEEFDRALADNLTAFLSSLSDNLPPATKLLEAGENCG